jgi:4-hydroxybenzoate polyprenyltransferase
VKLVRPTHWIKSGFCLAALFLSGEWANVSSWMMVLPVVVGFTLLSSAGYLFNDVMNREEDRHHPRKRSRPVASGRVRARDALVVSFLLALSGLGLLAGVYWPADPGRLVLVCALGYYALTILYSCYFRSVSYLDVATLCLGFVLRVAAGALAIGLVPTWWLMGTTYALALLLGFGKRLGEIKLMEGRDLERGETRLCLTGYRRKTLERLMAVMAFVAGGLYILYCLIGREDRGLFVFSVAPVVVGIFAYIRLAWRSDSVEIPEKLIFSSRVLLGSLVVWVAMVLIFGQW